MTQIFSINSSQSIWIHQRSLKTIENKGSVSFFDALALRVLGVSSVLRKYFQSIHLNPSQFIWIHQKSLKIIENKGSVSFFDAPALRILGVSSVFRGLIRANGLSNSNLISPYEHTLFNIIIFNVLRKTCNILYFSFLFVNMGKIFHHVLVMYKSLRSTSRDIIMIFSQV